jgi:protein-disulfide isomerase
MARQIIALFAVVAASWSLPGRADPCGQLAADKRGLAEKLFRSTHPYDCCDETLDRCLKQKKVCRLAVRLRDEICKRVAAGHDEKRITTALERRARSMMPSKRASIELSGSEVAGDAKAKVAVVVYACTRCPFCAQVVPELHRLATSGPLKGKIALYLKPFPISDHKGSKEGGLALEAAYRGKKFWPYTLKVYGEFKQFEVGKLPEWAAQVGLDREAFKREMASAQTLLRVVEAKREGIRNGVEQTPTIFLNGRKYQGELGREVLPDVLAEEVDRVAGRQY